MSRYGILVMLLVALALVVPGTSPLLAQDGDAPAVPDGDAPAPDGDADADNGDADNGDDDEMTAAEKLITPRGVEAVRSGLKFIAEQQLPNGSFGGRGSSSYTIAITSLAGLALIAGGHLPGRGPYGDQVIKTIDFLLNSQGNSGFFTIDGDGSRTHGHGFATLFLATVLGMMNDDERSRRVKRAVANAVDIIENSQTPEGGWGYVPDDRTWDEASTTVTLVQGLRAARDAGVRVERRVIEKAIRYVHRCAMRVDWVDDKGVSHIGYTFKYSLKYQNNRSTFPLTAAAVSTLQGSGRYEGEVLQGGLDWINAYFHSQMKDAPPNQNWYDRFYYYSHFYAAQSFFHAPQPHYWNNYFPRVRDQLIERQNSRTGTWPAPGGYGEVYATAIATLILQIPYGYLPMYQK